MKKDIEWKLDTFLDAVDQFDSLANAVDDGQWEWLLQDKCFTEAYGDYKSLDVNERAIIENEYSQIVAKCREDGLITHHAVQTERYTKTVKGRSFKGYQKTKTHENLKHYLNVTNIVVLTVVAVLGTYITGLDACNKGGEAAREQEELQLLRNTNQYLNLLFDEQHQIESLETRIEQLEKASSKGLPTTADKPVNSDMVE